MPRTIVRYESTVSARLPADAAKALRALAITRERSRSEVARRFLLEGIEREQQREIQRPLTAA
jgi:predicted transcriptional regulator